MGWLWILLSQVYMYGGALLMFWYPLVSSIMAIETQNKKDDQLWMTYWMVFALVSTVELIVAPVIPWIPLYSYFKLVVAAWLILPQSRGAIVLYKTCIHPFFATKKLTFANGDHLHISADATESAALYIKKYGADAFEALLKSATTNGRVKKAEKIEEVE